MARILGAKCRICRRLGTKLFLKGTRCETAHCAMEKRNKPPGQHGDKRVRLTDYGLHLREVQRAKKMYGVMQRQFTLYYKTALRKGGNTGDNLVQLLEQRLDNVLYRLSMANSRDHARQMVLHGHFHVNGKKVRIPSYRVQAGDILETNPRDKSKKIVQDAHENRKDLEVPSWLKVEDEPIKGTVVSIPQAEELATPLETQLIVEYMSR